MKQKDDYLWKEILEDVFDDFLRFLHPDADKVFDLNRGITFLDKELEQLFPPEDDEFAPKVVDKLAQVYIENGQTKRQSRVNYQIRKHLKISASCTP